MLTKQFISLLLISMATSFEEKMIKIGSRFEYFKLKPQEKMEHEKFAIVEDSFLSQTFDSALYQYPPPITPITMDTFNIDRIPTLHVDFEKLIPEDLTGLHRKLRYSLNLKLDKDYFNIQKFEAFQCSLSIIDYADFNYYIDVEEIEKELPFSFFESERMNIEKMNSKAKQYYYGLNFKLNKLNTSFSNGMATIQLNALIPYHIRYAEANQVGRILSRLSQNFDFATNCLKTGENEKEKVKLEQLKKIPRYNWSIKQAFPLEENILFFNLVANGKIQNFVIPAGNTKYKEQIKLATIIMVFYGMIAILYAVYSSYRYEQRLMKKIETENRQK